MNVVDIRCPGCNRWLAEAQDYGRSVCPHCGWEITVRSRGERTKRSHTTNAPGAVTAEVPLIKPDPALRHLVGGGLG